MEEFNNIEMTEDELDHVAGGQNYLVLERQKNGKITFTEFGYDGDIEQVKRFITDGSGGGFSVSSWSGGSEVGPGQLDELVKTYQDDGYVIIKKWEL
ncbi:MAG: hypothetical protein J6I62_08120 [Selenomonadaceae bacterium]|nr:hypothetical protein [Selenomonadaceae bacterium]